MESMDEQLAALEALAPLSEARAAAEARELEAMLAVADHLYAAHHRMEPRELRATALASIALEIAVATGWSEAQVQRRLAVAQRVRSDAPTVWLAFQAGRIDTPRVSAIASVIEKLDLAESKMSLDQSVVSYAESHTTAELKAWLKQFLARTEPERTQQRADAERSRRSVTVTHGDDAMSFVEAYVPSVAAAAIDRRLNHIAKQLHHDDRTLDQRRADLFMAWLTTAENGESAVGADVAVVVPAEVLAGAGDELAVSDDGRWITPASWLFDYARPEDVFWHRLLTDEAGGVLDYRYYGRFAPDALATAIRFRDRTCTAPGCLKPARECDNDHLRPFPEGPTCGCNMHALCRRHHRMKTQGVLTWVLPSGQTVPAAGRSNAPPTGPPSDAEDRFARLAIEYDAA